MRFVILFFDENILFEVNLKLSLRFKMILMVMFLQDELGVLYRVLFVFFWRNLNLLKIELCLIKIGLGYYFFIIDIEKVFDEVLISGVMQEFEVFGCKVKFLGVYQFY